MIKTTIRIDEAAAAEILRSASEQGHSFAAEVRRLVRKQLRQQSPPVRFEPVSGGQLSALHAKISQLAKNRDAEKAELKEAVVARAETQCRRSIESLGRLSRREASELLDWLESELES